MAGVITPSPTKSEMPINDRSDTNATCLLDFRRGTRISLSTIVPPSPRFPSLIASQVYWTVTSKISVQKISDKTPIRSARCQ
jgi:hypothetical protein